MEQWNSIRQRVLRDGVSIRQIQSETGLHYQTIKKILSHIRPEDAATKDLLPHESYRRKSSHTTARDTTLFLGYPIP